MVKKTKKIGMFRATGLENLDKTGTLYFDFLLLTEMPFKTHKINLYIFSRKPGKIDFTNTFGRVGLPYTYVFIFGPKLTLKRQSRLQQTKHLVIFGKK